jgi:hypothetical protein
MAGPGWRLLRSPVTQFLVVGLLAFAAIVVGARILTARAANDEAISDARRFTEVLADSVAQPVIPRGLVDGDPGAVDRFDRLATTWTSPRTATSAAATGWSRSTRRSGHRRASRCCSRPTSRSRASRPARRR